MSSQLRILLIEDERLVAEIYCRMLELLVAAFPGAAIARVDTLAEALDIIRGLAPDVAVLDLNLTDASSDQTISEIGNIALRCPVVVVTGLNEPGLRERTLAAGAYSFLHKTEIPTKSNLLERVVVAAVTSFKSTKRKGLGREIAALRKFATEHASET